LGDCQFFLSIAETTTQTDKEGSREAALNYHEFPTPQKTASAYVGFSAIADI